MKPLYRAYGTPIKRKGCGVVAFYYIHKGEHIETSHTISLDADDSFAISELGLRNICFRHPLGEESSLLTLGLSSLCKHSKSPNTHAVARDEGPVGWVIDLYAARDIKPGEDITRGFDCALEDEPDDKVP